MRRAFASFLAVWFAVITAEPAALHLCAMHGATDAPASHAGHHAPTAHDGAPTAHEHGAQQAQQQTDTQDEEQQQPASACTCLGKCSAATVAPLPQVTVSLAAPLAVRAAVAAFPQHRAAPTPAPGLRLPFSTAPPIFPA